MGKFVANEFVFKSLNIGLALDEGLANPTEKFTVFYGERAVWWCKVVNKIQSLSHTHTSHITLLHITLHITHHTSHYTHHTTHYTLHTTHYTLHTTHYTLHTTPTTTHMHYLTTLLLPNILI